MVGGLLATTWTGLTKPLGATLSFERKTETVPTMLPILSASPIGAHTFHWYPLTINEGGWKPLYPSHVSPSLPPSHSQSSQLSEMLAALSPADRPCYANFFTPEICSEQLPLSCQNKDQPQPPREKGGGGGWMLEYWELLHSLDCSISQMSPIEAICWWEMFIFVQIYRINSNFK